MLDKQKYRLINTFCIQYRAFQNKKVLNEKDVSNVFQCYSEISESSIYSTVMRSHRAVSVLH